MVSIIFQDNFNVEKIYVCIFLQQHKHLLLLRIEGLKQDSHV